MYHRVLERGRWNRCGRDYIDPCWNIHPLLWGGYKVYGVRICG